MCQSACSGLSPAALTDIRTMDDLRDFVHVELCRKENLLEHHFPMTEVELKKRQALCGVQFILHGPRSVKLTAVWDSVRNEVLLYDVVGKRFAKVRLVNMVA